MAYLTGVVSTAELISAVRAARDSAVRRIVADALQVGCSRAGPGTCATCGLQPLFVPLLGPGEVAASGAAPQRIT